MRDWIEKTNKDDGAKDVTEFKDAHRTVIEARDANGDYGQHARRSGLKEMKDESSIFGNRDAIEDHFELLLRRSSKLLKTTKTS